MAQPMENGIMSKKVKKRQIRRIISEREKDDKQKQQLKQLTSNKSNKTNIVRGILCTIIDSIKI